MHTPTQSTAEEARLHDLLEQGARAIRAKDLGGLMPRYAPDVVLFDVVGPLRHQGAEAVRRRMAEWFASFEGPIGYEMSDVCVDTAADLACCHRVNHVRATKHGGEQLSMRWRETTCYRKRNGQWVITHQHSSVPFDAASGQASLDLQS
ncbi:MAG: SgcJ/EcaC family oxidoreductase [Hymenobacter sp.]|nr:SgcJ/EcaC family oxidoreductase [Hymenobacter sp.]